MRVSMTQSYDPVAQILHLTGLPALGRSQPGANQNQRASHCVTLSRRELEALLYYNGFTIIRQYGDWNLEPLTAAPSPSILVVCRKHA